MKYRIFHGGLFCALLAWSSIPAVSAGSRSFKSKTPKIPETHLTVISAVTPTSLTIQEDKVIKSFTITPFTEVNVNGQRATLADLKPGMTVNVTLSDPSKLSRIDAGPTPVISSSPGR